MKEPRPHEREQQQRRQQSGPCGGGGLTDDGRRGGANGSGALHRGGAPMGAGYGTEPAEPRRQVQALHDLLVQFGAGQDRQDLRCPPGQVIVTPGLAGAALAQVPCHGQPKGSGQHHDLPPGAVGRIAVAASVGQ